MKQRIFLIFLLAQSLSILQAQQSSPQGDPDDLFQLGSLQFQEGEYAASYRTLDLWQQKSSNPGMTEMAQYLQAANAYHLNRRDASVLLIRFLRTYPASPYAEKAYYLLGCSAMEAGQFDDALEFFRRSPESSLNSKELIDYRFRYAYTSMRLGDTNTARNLFQDLALQASRYTAAASYFLSYLDYAEGDAIKAKDGFSKFNDHDQFKKVLPYFNIQLNYATGKTAEAIDSAKVLLDTKPGDQQAMELLRILGAAHFDVKDFASSRRYYTQYAALNPKWLLSDQYRRGVLAYMDGRYDDAEQLLANLLGQPDAIGQSAAYHLGMIYFKKGAVDMARMSFEQASLSHFDRATTEKALYNYALLCYQTSFSPFNDQVNAFERFLNEFPESELSKHVNAYLAEALLTGKDYVHSLEVLERIPNPDAQLKQTKARLHFLLGVNTYKQRQLPEALEQFTKSLDALQNLNLSTAEVYFWRGETFFALHQYENAKKDLTQFVNRFGSPQMNAWPDALYNLGYAHFYTKNYAASLEWFEKFSKVSGIQHDLRLSDALNRMGDAHFMARNFVKADQYYERSDKSTPGGNDYAIYQKAQTLGLRQQHAEKLELLSRFETRFPGSDYIDDVLFETGRTCIAIKQNALALTSFNRLMEKYPESPLSRKAGIQVALLHYNEGNSPDAMTAYKTVIARYPGSEEARIALSDLKTMHVAQNTVAEYMTYAENLPIPVTLNASEADSLSFLAAENLLMSGKETEAIKGFENYLQQYPQGGFVIDSHYHLGKLTLGSGLQDQAINHLKEVTRHNGHRYQIDALETLASVYFEDVQYQDALQQYQLLETRSENRITRLLARAGQMRSQYRLNQWEASIQLAGSLLKETQLDASLKQEAHYLRAKSYLSMGNPSAAKVDLTELSKEVQSAVGAESRFLLAELLYKQQSPSAAETKIQKFIQEGTPHSYWLARSFLLFSDILADKGEWFQAKQYLLSLKENYKADDEIASQIAERLQKIEQRNN